MYQHEELSVTVDEPRLLRVVHGNSLWLSPEVFIAHADRLFHLAPQANEIRFFTQQALDAQQQKEKDFNYYSFLIFQEMSGYGALSVELLRALASCPQLARVSSLIFTSNTLGDEGVQALTQSPHLTALSTLQLCQARISDKGVEALLVWSGVQQLRRLLLSRNGITDQGVKALAASSNLGQLAELGLGENPIHEEGLQALIHSPHLTSLQTVELSGTPIGPRIEYTTNDNGFEERIGYDMAAAIEIAKRFRRPIRIC
jgi:hypothetical protein